MAEARDPACAEVRDLIWQLEEDASAIASLGRLEELLSGDRNARREYAHYMRLVADLEFDSQAARQAPPAPVKAGSPVLGFLASIGRFLPGGDVVVGGLVLLAVTGALGGLVYYIQTKARMQIASGEPAKQSAPAPGTVVGSLATDAPARWSPEMRPQRAPVARVGEQYELSSGRVQLVLSRGARVVIEGPAAWQFESEQRVQFRSGKLVAHVPRSAVGFTVVTPAAEVIDLGTEFGVEVDSRGSTDLHVIKGRVQFLPVADPKSRSARKRVVTGGQAMRVAVGSPKLVTIPIDVDRFRESEAAAIQSWPAAPGSTAAFLQSDPIWLGNLFDDPAGTPLAQAMWTDTFQATPDDNDLGVERVIHAGNRPTRPGEPNWVAERVWPDGLIEIAPGVKCNLKNLGWSGMVHGSIANDASAKFPAVATGGIQTRGTLVASNGPAVEEGIGMHADSLLTFDLDEIRAAGGLEKRRLKFVCDRAGVNDDDVGGIRHKASLHMAVFVSGTAGVQAAVVNGKATEMINRSGVWSVASPPDEPLRANGQFVSFRVPVGADARYLTLVSLSADGDNDMDHAAWSGARLEVVP